MSLKTWEETYRTHDLRRLMRCSLFDTLGYQWITPPRLLQQRTDGLVCARSTVGGFAQHQWTTPRLVIMVVTVWA